MTVQLSERTEKLKAWIAALRSGKYTQGRSSLAQKGPGGELSFCCLGVACEIAGLVKAEVEMGERLVYKWQVTNNEGKMLANGVEDAILPPQLVREQAYPKVLSTVPVITVISANDSFYFTFEQIADTLESVYLGDGTIAEKIIGEVYPKVEGFSLNAAQFEQMRLGFETLKREFEEGRMK